MSYNKETGMWEGYIYLITNDVNDCVYIGQTRRTLNERFYEHKYYAKNLDKHPSIHLYNAMSKYGIDNFHINSIDCFAKENLKDLCKELNNNEFNYIKLYKEKQYSLYNMSLGGDVIAQESSVPVLQYSLDGILIHTYESPTIAGEITGTSRTSICSCCLHKDTHFTANGYIWRYIDDELSLEEIIFYKNKYKDCAKHAGVMVNQYSLNKEFIKTYKTMSQASQITNTNINSISSVCNNNSKTAGGYIWRFACDDIDTYVFDTPYKEIPIIKLKNGKQVEKRDRTTGELYDIFCNFTEAAKNVSFDNYVYISSCIRKCCEHIDGMVTSCGFHWCYSGQFNKDDLNKVKNKRYDAYDLDGNYVDTFESGMDCLKFLNITNKGAITDIRNVCLGNRKQAYGYVWRYYGDDFNKYGEIDFTSKKSKPISQYDLNMNLLFKYKGIKEIKEKYDFDTTGIYECCNNHLKSSHGYIWKYA